MNKDNEILLQNVINDTTISQEDVIKAQIELKKHVKNKDFYRIDQYKINFGTQISKNYSNLNQRRSFYSDCYFTKSNFTNTGFTGSIFSNCNFTNNLLKRTVFDSC